jgi:hypothetical protein
MLSNNSNNVSEDSNNVMPCGGHAMSFGICIRGKANGKLANGVGNKRIRPSEEMGELYKVLKHIDKKIAHETLERFNLVRRWVLLRDSILHALSGDVVAEMDITLQAFASVYLARPIISNGVRASFSFSMDESAGKKGVFFVMIFPMPDKFKLVSKSGWERIGTEKIGG